MDEKKRLRSVMLAQRDSISVEERIEKSLLLAGQAEKLDISPGAIVSGFLPIRSEPDLRPLMARLRERGARLCLPVVLDRETVIFKDFVRGAELVDTGFGTFGPPEAASVLDPDVLLVPLAAFDRHGNRLGYGAGHYDRAIARLHAKGGRPRLVGIAFEMQETDKVPSELHDVQLDMVLTESGLRSCQEAL